MTMTAGFPSLHQPTVERRNPSVWRQFFATMIEGPTPRAEHEIAEYLQRHQHDLPPALWIELERRRVGP